jgi:Domain of unknown function (DUF4262)
VGHDDRCSAPSPEVALHQCRADIARVGWHCTGVFDDPASGAPPFAYTTGLTAKFRKPGPHPELVIAGLDPRQGYSVLVAAVRLIEGGARFADGDQVDEIAASFPVRFKAVDPAACSLHFGMSSAFYGGRSVARLQVVWPDPAGLFPGEAGCVTCMARIQDIRGFPPGTSADHA